MEKRKLNLFSKIQDMEDASKMIKDSAIAFYFLAALQGLAGFLLAPALIVDGVVFFVLAFFLHKFKSRIASVILLLMTVLSLISTFYNKFGSGGEGGNNLLLALFAIGIAVRAVEATFKYQKYIKESKL